MTLRSEEESPRKRPTRKVKIWDEVTIRVGVGEYDFIRFTHGQEAIVTNNTATKVKAEREMHASIIEIVEARLEEYKQLIADVQTERQ